MKYIYMKLENDFEFENADGKKTKIDKIVQRPKRKMIL